MLGGNDGLSHPGGLEIIQVTLQRSEISADTGEGLADQNWIGTDCISYRYAIWQSSTLHCSTRCTVQN